MLNVMYIKPKGSPGEKPVVSQECLGVLWMPIFAENYRKSKLWGMFPEHPLFKAWTAKSL